MSKRLHEIILFNKTLDPKFNHIRNRTQLHRDVQQIREDDWEYFAIQGKKRLSEPDKREYRKMYTTEFQGFDVEL